MTRIALSIAVTAAAIASSAWTAAPARAIPKRPARLPRQRLETIVPIEYLVDFRASSRKLEGTVRSPPYRPASRWRFTVTDTPSRALSRRDMMKQTTAVAAASAFAGLTIPHVHAGENNTVNVVLVGCG